MTPTQRRKLERLIDAKVSAAIGYGVGAYAARETLSKAGTDLMHYLDEVTDYRAEAVSGGMTRDELPHAIGVALVKARERIPRDEWSDYDGEADDILPLIDQYVADERERIAQAIEALPFHNGDPSQSYLITTDYQSGHRRAQDHAARIARTEAVSGE